ncbi:hypothetical protein EVAR_39714_1 [Eumeta japonica]|uniref:Uncharacterized protein n=1 Tax=Eumeta variegata TaxID=151549 RepID=A0A4C1W883_EUMVA|nr:hypothetical protein EVAR_39714_1 [Eumeta japonica]
MAWVTIGRGVQFYSRSIYEIAIIVVTIIIDTTREREREREREKSIDKRDTGSAERIPTAEAVRKTSKDVGEQGDGGSPVEGTGFRPEGIAFDSHRGRAPENTPCLHRWPRTLSSSSQTANGALTRARRRRGAARGAGRPGAPARLRLFGVSEQSRMQINRVATGAGSETANNNLYAIVRCQLAAASGGDFEPEEVGFDSDDKRID